MKLPGGDAAIVDRQKLTGYEIEGPHGTGIPKSAWIVRRGESAPRLTSCFVK